MSELMDYDEAARRFGIGDVRLHELGRERAARVLCCLARGSASRGFTRLSIPRPSRPTE